MTLITFIPEWQRRAFRFSASLTLTVDTATFGRKLVEPFRDGRGFEAEMRTDGPGI